MKKHQFLDLAEVNAPYMDEMAEAAGRVIRSGRYVGGVECESFENELGKFLGAPYIIGVSNGLDALRLILKGWVEMGILTPGDEVIVPANTYIASVLAVSDAGLVPVPVDADLTTMNIDTSKIEAAVTPRTKALMVVHLYGRIVWDEKIIELARRYGLKVIEDNAQAIGAEAPVPGFGTSGMAGSLADAGAISFYPTKNLGAVGDAGAVVTGDEKLARVVRALSNYGSDRRYHNIYCGYNCRLDPIQAAMMRVKLPHLKEENDLRRTRARLYDRLITTDAVIKPDIVEDSGDHVWHQYVVRVPGGRRDELKKMLEDEGVMTDIHYAVPFYRQPCYEGRWNPADFPVSEKLASEVLSLPVGPGTKPEDIEEITSVINRFV